MGNMTLGRLDETILFTLSAAKERGISNLSKFELMKLIYLIEVNSMRYIGDQFTQSVKFVREKNGPISYDIYKSTEKLQALGLIDIELTDNPEYGYPRYCHSLKKSLPELSFEDSEKMFLESVLSDYLGLQIAKLKAVAYGTEPMQEMMREEKELGVKTLKGKKIDFDTVHLDEDVMAGMML